MAFAKGECCATVLRWCVCLSGGSWYSNFLTRGGGRDRQKGRASRARLRLAMAVWASLGKEAREGEIRNSPEGSAAGEAPSCSHVWGGLDSITSVFHQPDLAAGGIIAPWAGGSSRFAAAYGFLDKGMELLNADPNLPMVAPSVESGSPPPAGYSSKNPKAVYSALLDESRTFLTQYGLSLGSVARAVRAGPRALGPWGWG